LKRTSGGDIQPVAMTRAEEYRVNAEESERLANKAATEHERETYRRIARAWWDLVQEAIIGEKRGV